MIEAHICLIDVGEKLDDIALQREHFKSAESLLDSAAAGALEEGHTYARELAERLV